MCRFKFYIQQPQKRTYKFYTDSYNDFLGWVTAIKKTGVEIEKEVSCVSLSQIISIHFSLTFCYHRASQFLTP